MWDTGIVKSFANGREDSVKAKYEVQCENMRFCDAIIDKEILIDDSDYYVKTCLEHYMHSSNEETPFKPFEIRKYLKWIPFSLASTEESDMHKNLLYLAELLGNRIELAIERKMHDIRENGAKEIKDLLNEILNMLKEE